MSKTIVIGNKRIGKGQPCFIVAEIGSNFNQDIKTAFRLVDAAKKAGADAVKFQSFKVEDWMSKELKSFPTVRANINLYDFLKKAELSDEMYKRIKKYCLKKKIICFSSPSSIEDIKRLMAIGVPAFKFGSVQITDIPTLQFAAGTGKPIILSTGASTLEDIHVAIRAIEEKKNHRIIILHCTTMYPTPCRHLNFNLMAVLKNSFGYPIGFSDHSMDAVLAPVIAVSLGACVIEKHLTLNRMSNGPDHKFALEPKEFFIMVKAIRQAELAQGHCVKKILPEETEIARLGRRSIVTRQKISKGDVIKKEYLTTKRPGYGIPPKDFNRVVGAVAREDIPEDKVLTWRKIKIL